MTLRYLNPWDSGSMIPMDTWTLLPLDLWTSGLWDSGTSSYFWVLILDIEIGAGPAPKLDKILLWMIKSQEILCYWWNKTCCIKLSGTQHDRAVNVILHFPLLRLGWMIIVSIFHVISTFINFLYNFQHQKLTQNRSCDKWGGEAEVVSKISFKYFG